MSIQAAYDQWAHQYDSNKNKTRDLEAIALRQTLEHILFNSCLEIGCGTGKNTEWLLTKAGRILAVDLSEEMLAKAKEKTKSEKVSFIQADINQEWNFAANELFDLAIFSLVLEHIEHLDTIFENLSNVVRRNGYVYIGELHPFKQYTGSKARFESETGTQVVTCFTHHISDFTAAAKKHNFSVIEVNEYFDDNDRSGIPRILSLLLRKTDP